MRLGDRAGRRAARPRRCTTGRRRPRRGRRGRARRRRCAGARRRASATRALRHLATEPFAAVDARVRAPDVVAEDRPQVLVDVAVPAGQERGADRAGRVVEADDAAGSRRRASPPSVGLNSAATQRGHQASMIRTASASS